MSHRTTDQFPTYTTAETIADAVVHVIGVVAAIVGTAWILTSASGSEILGSTFSLSIYCVGLLAMLSASAAYNLTPPGQLKAFFRRLDHAFIFLMIAGTYTPFTMHIIEGWPGTALGIAIWCVAAAGIILKLFFPHRLEWISLFLYIAMGWMLVAAIGPVLNSLDTDTLWLLLAGGIIYTIGAGVHVLRRLPFHNVIWHGMVLGAAGLHYASIYTAFIA